MCGVLTIFLAFEMEMFLCMQNKNKKQKNKPLILQFPNWDLLLLQFVNGPMLHSHDQYSLFQPNFQQDTGDARGGPPYFSYLNFFCVETMDVY